MPRPLLILEDLDRPRRHLLTVLGVRYTATPAAWLNLPLSVLSGVPIGLAWRWGSPIGEGLALGLVVGAGVLLLNTWHNLGHVISARLAGAPMDEIALTVTRQANRYYGDQSRYPRRVHLIRALGGPAANLLAALILAGAHALWPGDALLISALLNVAAGLGALAPIPSLDGWVIWGLEDHRQTAAAA